MFLTKIKLLNFKNYSQATIQFEKKVNVVFGQNGSGKTNFLDAIHFLSVSKSYFGLSDKYLIKDEEEYYRIDGFYQFSGKEDHLFIKYKRDRKREINLNSKKLEKVSDLIGKFPVVLIAPDDIKIVKGTSKERRDYFNKWLCQADHDYLNALVEYNRLLRQKDATLKADYRPDHIMVASFNERMIPLAERIHGFRKKALYQFADISKQQYNLISHGSEAVHIEYQSDFNDQSPAELFNREIQNEIFARRPLVGIQKDDFEFTINNRSLKKYGSQGQIKSWLYSMRLAEFQFLFDAIKKKPILILDDYFEKLDKQRLTSLLNLIGSDEFGQVFLSDTEIERSQEILESRGIDFDSFFVDEGNIGKV